MRTLTITMISTLAACGVGTASGASRLTIDVDNSVLRLDATGNGDVIVDVRVGGDVDIVTGPGTAGIQTILGSIVDPIQQEVTTADGILAFDVPANGISFSANSTELANPLLGGSFDQSNLNFAFTGSVGGSLLLGSVAFPFSLDLANAVVSSGNDVVGATLTASSDGTSTLALPLNLVLEAPLSIDGTPSGGTLPVTVTGNVVARGVVPEPAGLSLLGLGGMPLRRRRR